jgi:hypothetical protein
MTYEQASLTQQESRGNLALVLEQRPLVVGWFELGFAAMMLAFVSVFFTGNLLGLVVFAGFFPVMFGAVMVRRPASLTLTPVSLQVSAWAGWPARPAGASFALDQVSLRHEAAFQLNSLILHKLIISDGEQERTVPGLVCTTEELEQVIALIETRRAHARELVGDGEAEVPEALRKFLRPPQAEG